jgi:SAM-dependent methyltransferase
LYSYIIKNMYHENSDYWIKQQKSQKHLSYIYLEKPAMYSLLPNLEGKKVLCIGCGSGEECGYIKKQGALVEVLGIDNAPGLIEAAKYTYPDCQFEVMDLTRLDFADGSFDFVYSSLAIHYAKDWKAVFTKVNKILKENGEFLFSVHHPIKWGAHTERSSDQNSFLMGYSKNKKTGGYQIYGDYLNSREIEDKLFNKINIKYWHYSISDILRQFRSAGFILEDMVEPKPLESVRNTHPDFWEVYSKIPIFLIFRLKKG